MATLIPFRALRPTPDAAARVAAVPYDVVNADEARAYGLVHRVVEGLAGGCHAERAQPGLPSVRGVVSTGAKVTR